MADNENTSVQATEDGALGQLQAMATVPGVLKVITSEHACGGGLHPSIAGFKQSACDAFGYPVSDPRHFVLHDVVSVESRQRADGRVLYRATTAEGDYTEGDAPALLRRLLEWQYA